MLDYAKNQQKKPEFFEKLSKLQANQESIANWPNKYPKAAKK